MELTDHNFEQEVYHSDIPVFVDFWASWCPPCKMMEPVIAALEKHYQGQVKVCKINIDKNRVIASKFEIKGVPLFILFKGGKIVDQAVAAKTEDQLKEMIDKVLV